MVSALDQLKVAAGVALVATAPIVAASIEAKCNPAGVVCEPAAPVQPDEGAGNTPKGPPPATVQVFAIGTGTGTGRGTVMPARGLTWAMQDDAPYRQNHSVVWSSVR